MEKHTCICTNKRLENGLMYLCQAFQFNMVKTFTTIIIKSPPSTVEGGGEDMMVLKRRSYDANGHA